MVSLLLLAGALLAFGEPVISTQSALDRVAAEQRDEALINKIIQYQNKLKEEAKRRKQNKEENENYKIDDQFIEEKYDPEEPVQKEIDLDTPVQEINFEANENRDEQDTNEDPTTTTEVVHAHPANPEALASQQHGHEPAQDTNLFLYIVVAGCSVAGLIGLIMAGVCWYKLHSRVKAASDVEYPAYGVTGPTKERLPSPGDRKLAQSAQMYHYQHQKQQMIAMEKANGEMKQDASEDESEEENEEGDYTVYECPGLAPTGEMEVRNPLFTEESTPVNGQPPAVNGLDDDQTAE